MQAGEGVQEYVSVCVNCVMYVQYNIGTVCI